VADAEARVDTATAWGTPTLPTEPGRDTAGIIAAAAAGELAGLVVAGVEVDDLPDPQAAIAALEVVPFLVSLEVRTSAVTSRADVVLPVSAVTEKAGTFLDWEGRPRSFEAVLREPGSLSDGRVVDLLAGELGSPLGLGSVADARRELAELEGWSGGRAQAPAVAAAAVVAPEGELAVLSTWHHLLDAGRMQDGEPNLAGTAPSAVARVSAGTAERIGAADAGWLRVSTERGTITLPLVCSEVPDGVVWLPTNSAGAPVRRALAADHGSTVRIAAATGGAA
jgi:NADH-quinone oxidoreductase subunit G